jgi:hypothetical protein
VIHQPSGGASGQASDIACLMDGLSQGANFSCSCVVGINVSFLHQVNNLIFWLLGLSTSYTVDLLLKPICC